MHRFLVIVALLVAAAPAHAENAKIVIGSVPSPTAVGTYIAIDKGYFRDAASMSISSRRKAPAR